MAVLNCNHCGYTKGVTDQYAGKMVKCPECEQPAKVYDTALLLTAYSKKVLEIQSELKEVKQVITEYKNHLVQPIQPVSDELPQSLNKLFRENRIAMTEFNDATKLRNSMILRIQQESSHLMRFTVIGFLVILGLIAFLVIQATEKNQHVSDQLAVIGGHIQASTQELQVLKTTALSLNTDDSKQDAVKSIQSNVEKLEQKIERLNQELEKMSDNYDALLYPYR
jgi:DNA repair exonuclease SbcCD ATPase subunit